MKREMEDFTKRYLEERGNSGVDIRDPDSWWQLFDHSQWKHDVILSMLSACESYDERIFLETHYWAIFEIACINYVDEVLKSKWAPLANFIPDECYAFAWDRVAEYAESEPQPEASAKM